MNNVVKVLLIGSLVGAMGAGSNHASELISDRGLTTQTPGENPDDIYWDTSISPSVTGTDGSIHSLVTFGGELIAAGLFDSIGNVAAANIAKWNGSAWAPLGAGTNNLVGTLTVYKNALVAGGQFTMAGGDSAITIASWDGLAWTNPGALFGTYIPGTSPSTNFVFAFNDTLYASDQTTPDECGGFYCGPSGAVRWWDGNAWSHSSNVADFIFASTVLNGDLVICDYDPLIPYYSSSYSWIKRWNGGDFMDVPFTDTVYGIAHAMTVYEGKLVVAGQFSVSGNAGKFNIVIQNGESWSAMGTGIDGAVYAVAIYDNKLIAGGSISSAGGTTVNNIAAWNGTSWSALGSGVNGPVRALSVFNDKLVVGGEFTSAGSKVAKNIALWTKQEPTDVNDHPISTLPDNLQLYQNYPNPFNPSTHIDFAIPVAGLVSLEIVDLMGRRVRTLVSGWMSAGRKSVDWDGHNDAGQEVASGVYLYLLKTSGGSESRKMTLLK